VWVPKYRKAVLTGEVALRGRDLWRPIAAEHEREIVSGQVARDPVHLFLSYRPNQDVSQIVPWRKSKTVSKWPMTVDFPSTTPKPTDL
jgi:REP-associated tyrosine transposase